MNVIAAFDTTKKQWDKIGKLNQARSGHGVIVHQGQFIVVGGGFLSAPIGTERCKLKDDSMKCTTVDPELKGYRFYPEMMSVPGNFCQKQNN